MNKWHSFGWGLLCNLAGGLFVAILVYLLYLKKRKVNLLYFFLGFFSILIVLFAIGGTVVIFGVWGLWQS
ncbi:MAG: hypothetical protein HWN68_07750 [Desulfobacterales bacterium]|nr:hypothetical protein [Desulfobacterales bacterium]